jgi:hypothetical protein
MSGNKSFILKGAMAIRYGFVGLRFKLRCAPENFLFSIPDQTDPGTLSHSLLYNGYQDSFLEVKRSGRGVGHPPHLASSISIITVVALLPLCASYGMLQGNLYGKVTPEYAIPLPY